VAPSISGPQTPIVRIVGKSNRARFSILKSPKAIILCFASIGTSAASRYIRMASAIFMYGSRSSDRSCNKKVTTGCAVSNRVRVVISSLFGQLASEYSTASPRGLCLALAVGGK